MREPRCSLVCIALLATLALGLAAKLEPAAEFVHEDAAGKLAIIGKAAVVMTGNDPFINRIMEDVLAISLMGQGIKVAYPDENSFGKPRHDMSTDPIQVARAAGANVLVTGTVITQPPGEFQYRSVQVSIASLSLVDVPQDKTLVWALYEPDEATSTSKIAKAFVEKLVDALK